jgi:hypothetical protein
LSNPVPAGDYTITVRGTSASPVIIRTVDVILNVSEGGGGGGGVIPPFEEF